MLLLGLRHLLCALLVLQKNRRRSKKINVVNKIILLQFICEQLSKKMKDDKRGYQLVKRMQRGDLNGIDSEIKVLFSLYDPHHRE